MGKENAILLPLGDDSMIRTRDFARARIFRIKIQQAKNLVISFGLKGITKMDNHSYEYIDRYIKLPHFKMLMRHLFVIWKSFLRTFKGDGHLHFVWFLNF